MDNNPQKKFSCSEKVNTFPLIDSLFPNDLLRYFLLFVPFIVFLFDRTPIHAILEMQQIKNNMDNAEKRVSKELEL
jgi:hypothetical protein